MQNSSFNRVILLIILISIGNIRLAAQMTGNINPLKIRPLLSGSFGELRATHFHSGIDLRTGGQEGVPVLAVNDGVVARISVSPSGYGNALYLEHSDGTTTVYGHLQRYNKKITDVVRELQYRQESFRIDEDMKGYRLFFKQGDTIAYSGNSGSSGGPHLHFEYRDTKTERTLNPLHYIKIKDNISPDIKALYFYDITKTGQVNRLKKNVPVTTDKKHYSAGRISLPAGRIGIGISAVDAMNDSWSKLGIYKMVMQVNGKEVFKLTMDSCAFDQACLINEIKDFELYNKSYETVYCSFGNYLHRLSGVVNKDKGYIDLEEGKETIVEITVSDINKNTSVVNMKLFGSKAQNKQDNRFLHYDRSHKLTIAPYCFEIDEQALFYSVDSVVRTDTLKSQTGGIVSLFIIADQEEPLMKNAKISVIGVPDEKDIICRVTKGGALSALVTRRDSLGIYAYTNILGRYTVKKDTLAPQVQYLGIVGDKLKFRIKDDLSGILEYRGEVNGRWCLFEYDAKSGVVSCRRTEPAFVKGQPNQVRFLVTDVAGNQTEKNLIIKN